MLAKAALRKELLHWRRELAAAQHCLWDSDLAMALLRLPQYQAADTVLCYISAPEEVSTTAIIAHALASGKRVGVPRWHRGEMVFCAFTDYRDLHPDRMGLLQPDQAAPVLTDLAATTLCVVPALAADSDGYRIGYGGGYYDRFLKDFAGMSAALVYRLLPVGELPREQHDIPAQLVLSPGQVLTTNQRKELYL